MKMINLKELWKINKSSNLPLFGNSQFLETFDFMQEYLTNYNKIDRNFIIKKGFFYPVWNLNEEETEDDVLAMFKSDVQDVIFKHKEQLKHLYEINNLEYNPIENYNGSLHYKEEKKGTDTFEDNFDEIMQTDNHGDRTKTENLGQIKETLDYGKKTNTETIGKIEESETLGAEDRTTTIGQKEIKEEHGAQKETNKIGEQNNTTTTQTAAFNSSTFEDNTKVEEDLGQRTDEINKTTFTDTTTDGEQINKDVLKDRTNTKETKTRQNETTEGAHTDDKITESRTNTETEKAFVDTQKTEARNDIHTTTYGNYTEYKEEKSGNLGQTQTQDMIFKESDLWSLYNFYDKLYNFIIEELCTYYDEGITML